MFAVGTEIHLVNRMARRFAPEGKRVITLDDTGCLCTTMYRISPQHLAWALENLVEGRVVNRIQVQAEREALGQGGAGPDAGSWDEGRDRGTKGTTGAACALLWVRQKAASNFQLCAGSCGTVRNFLRIL